VSIEAAGEKKRSKRMPAACPFSGRPVELREVEPILPPLLHLGDAPAVELRTITWEEVRSHRAEGDLWVVFGGQVYDVSAFATHHPGGLAVMLNGAGRDMTTAFEKAGHSDLTRTFALNYRIGRIESGPPPKWTRPESLVYAQTH
jgi:cytochrome b involved in lipid metabolism